MRTSLTVPTGLAAVLALCSIASLHAAPLSLQEPRPTGEAEPRENSLNRFKRVQREQRSSGLLGAWQLLRYETQGAVLSAGEIRGNAMFADGFMSLVIHATGFEEDTGQEFDMAQAGIFRFEVDDFSAVQSLTVIGHATPPGIDPAEAEIALIEEPAGGMREYRVRVEKDRVEMQHFSGTKLTFLRMQPSVLSGLEIARLGEERAEEPVDGSETVEAVAEAPIEDQVLGGWFLAGYMAGGVPLDDDRITGAAVIGDGYMSLVIHAYDDLVDDRGLSVGEVLLAQAGIYRYRVKDSKMLQTSTVIGHSNPEYGVEYEAQGGLRQYDLSIEDKALILRGLDGTALRFVRMNPRKFTDVEQATFNRYGRGLDLIEDE